MADIKGMRELVINVDRFTKEAKEQMSTALKAGALIIQNEAKRIAKDKGVYETGTLIRSIHTEEVSQNEVRVGTDVFYAPFHEYGTRKMGARPYLRPALDENKNKVIAKVEQVLSFLTKK